MLLQIGIAFIRNEADHFMLEIDIRRVINIEDDKLFYRSMNDEVSSIDLKAIAEQHKKEIGYSGHFEYQSVGEREYPYYHLYSPEGIKLYLEIPKKSWLKRLISKVFGWNFNVAEQKLWYSIQVMLNENGYTTLDLS